MSDTSSSSPDPGAETAVPRPQLEELDEAGPVHHVESAAERASVMETGLEPWPGGARELFLRITPSRITGRRIRLARETSAG